MRIFIGLREIAGHYKQLKEGFGGIGVKSDFIDLYNHPFKYNYFEKKNIFVKGINFFSGKGRFSNHSHSFTKFCWTGCWLLLRFFLFIWAIIKYDIFIFGFGSSFFYYYDLPILKLLNKKIIYKFHGSDCRPPYLSGAIVSDENNFNTKQCIKLSQERKKSLKKIEKYSDIIISYPLFSQFLERPFIASTNIGLPFNSRTPPNSDKSRKENVPGSQRKIRLLHAPTKPIPKGTEIIRRLIIGLQKAGHPIEFIEIKNASNEQVLDELSRCDFVIDQVFSDTPMAGFAREAASYSKPAVVGGYAKAEFSTIYSAGKIPPSLYIKPESLEKAIVKLIENDDYRIKLGKNNKDFVNENWAPQKIARKYLQLIENNIPADWWYDPNKITYVHGAGLPEKRTKEVIRSLIETGGKKALQLSDKPYLEKLIVEFAYSLDLTTLH